MKAKDAAATDEERQAWAHAEARRCSGLRMQMLEAHPFWGYLLLQVELVAAPELPAFAATDCIRRIWYNPEWTRHLDDAQLGFVMAHEVGHAIFVSGERRAMRDAHLWNCATDYAINRVVASIPNAARPREPMYRSPNGKYPGIGRVEILDERRFDGLIAEAIYERLLSETRAGPKGLRVRLPDLDGDSNAAGANGRSVEGSDHGGGIDIHLPNSLSPSERERIGDRVRAAVAHAQTCAHAGNIPGDIARAFSAGAPARVAWQRVLRSFVSRAVTRDEFDSRRPNLRWWSQGAVVPGRMGESVGTIVVALDTSGSISGDQLAAVVAEIRALRRMTADFRLIVADARVHEDVDVDGIEAWLGAGRAKGGGGTDHRPVFDYLRERRIVPDVFVGLTDLYSKFPAKAPAFPVVWVVPAKHGECTFGRVIEVGG